MLSARIPSTLPEGFQDTAVAVFWLLHKGLAWDSGNSPSGFRVRVQGFRVSMSFVRLQSRTQEPGFGLRGLIEGSSSGCKDVGSKV